MAREVDEGAKEVEVGSDSGLTGALEPNVNAVFWPAAIDVAAVAAVPKSNDAEAGAETEVGSEAEEAGADAWPNVTPATVPEAAEVPGPEGAGTAAPPKLNPPGAVPAGGGTAVSVVVAD